MYCQMCPAGALSFQWSNGIINLLVYNTADIAMMCMNTLHGKLQEIVIDVKVITFQEKTKKLLVLGFGKYIKTSSLGPGVYGQSEMVFSYIWPTPKSH